MPSSAKSRSGEVPPDRESATSLSGSASQSTPPPGLAALESSDGEVAILSFALPPDGVTLSRAEIEVVTHILAGHSNAAIAALRKTSPRTVANQISNIYRKLGVGSRLELVVLASSIRALGAPGKRGGRGSQER
jgi:two-component system, NarL family, nitrate/nitrite response regulator NarL